MLKKKTSCLAARVKHSAKYKNELNHEEKKNTHEKRPMKIKKKKKQQFTHMPRKRTRRTRREVKNLWRTKQQE